MKPITVIFITQWLRLYKLVEDVVAKIQAG